MFLFRCDRVVGGLHGFGRAASRLASPAITRCSPVWLPTLWAAVTASLLSACPTLPVPQGAVLLCLADEECPSGFLCRGGTNESRRCLPVDAERVPPALDPATTFSPAVAGIEEELTVSLVASEPLALPPTLELRMGGERRAFVVDELDDEGRRTTARCRVLAADRSGSAEIFATLTDRAGNSADVLVGILAIDTSAPVVTAASAAPAAVRLANTLTVALSANEPLASDSFVRLRDPAGTGRLLTSIVDGNTLVATLVVDEDMVEGEHEFFAVLIDQAHNATDVRVADRVNVDRVTPVVAIESSVDVAALGGVLNLTFRSSEQLASLPEVVLVSVSDTTRSRPVEVAVLGGNLYSATTTVTEDDVDGAYRFIVSNIIDDAGNVGAALVRDGIEVDRRIPSFVHAPRVEPEVVSRVVGFTVATLSFSLDEPAETTAAALDDGTWLVCDEDEPALPAVQAWRCAIDAFELVGDGQRSLFLAVVDRAGNHRLAATGFTIDVMPPQKLQHAISFSPPAGSVLTNVTRLTAGASATVAFTLDDGDATATVFSRPPALTFAPADVAGEGTRAFTSTVSPDAIEGEVELVLDVQDGVGNAAQIPLGMVTIDRTPPERPRVDVADAVVYERIPWGSDDTGGARRFALHLAAEDRPADAAYAIAWARREKSAEDELARVALDALGHAELDLGAADRAAVFLTFVDRAGNESDDVIGGSVEATGVRDVRFTATLGGKLPGSPLANPHTFFSTPSSSSTLSVLGASEANGARTAGADGNAVVTQAAGVAVRAGDAEAGGPSALARVAFDTARGRLVAFDRPRPDVWEHDGHRWHAIATVDPEGDGDPHDRQAGAALVYDPARGETLLLGGNRAPTPEAWAYNGRSWRRVATDCTSTPERCPSERANPAAAYDEERDTVVVFGGSVPVAPTVNEALGDTWLWDGQRFAPACGETALCASSPPPRYGASLVYDRSRGVLVLFGGHDGTNALADTWEWDGSWHERAPLSSPPPRSFAAAGFDDDSGKIIVAGGGAFDQFPVVQGPVLADAWAYDGALDTWQALPTEAEALPPRAFSSAASSPDGLLFFGGLRGVFTDDRALVRLKHGGVQELTSVVHPVARAAAAMAFDEQRGLALLFGGRLVEYGLGNLPSDADTLWQWDGVRWGQAAQGEGPKPSARAGAAMAYDRRRGVTVLFGGEHAGGDCDGGGALCPAIVWEWNGSAWRAIPTAGAGPEPRQGHAMTWDDERGVVVLFGGKPNLDYGPTPAAVPCDGRDQCDLVWQWDGETWTGVVPEDAGDGIAQGRERHVLGFDPVTREVLLTGGSRQFTPSPSEPGPFGACDDCGVTWLWNGVRWRRAASRFVPPAAWSGRAVLDAERGRLVVVGQDLDGAQALDVREWDGVSWTKRPLGDPENDGTPEAVMGAGVAFDERRGVIVLFGGDPRDGARDDATWLLDLGGRRAVGQQFGFTFAAAEAPPTATLLSLHVSAIGNGERQFLDRPALHHAALLVWDARWRTVATHDAEHFAPLRFSTTNPIEIRRLLTGLGRALHLSVRGDTTGSAASSVVATDALSATLAYRLPRGVP
jgi:hypothetical protein